MWKYLLDSIHSTGTIKKSFQNIWFTLGPVLWEANPGSYRKTWEAGKREKLTYAAAPQLLGTGLERTAKTTAQIQALKHKDVITVGVLYHYVLSWTDKITAWENKMGGRGKEETTFVPYGKINFHENAFLTT